MSNLFYPLTIPAIVIIFYYYAFFSEEKIKKYSNTLYSIFIFHLIILYMWLFIEVSELSIGSPFNNTESTFNNIIYTTMSVLQLI
jgi:hypothetical protein